MADGPRASLARWIELLCEWNARIDLTAARSAGELVDLMVADAHALSRHLAPGARVVDVGTGAGAPGMALALLRPDLVVTLCEPLAKRVSFLRTVIGTLGRTDVTLVGKRGEELAEGAWDVAVSRATLNPPEWLALGAKLVKPGGSVWVLLATGEPPVLPGAQLAGDERYEWPETRAQRRAARFEIRGG
ncbi:MAG TPA: RsmG family class I SAM-dependent methyltransferase [Polyangiaceae bacterium]